jgi:hypothetical protein
MKLWLIAFAIAIPFGAGGLVLVAAVARGIWWLLSSANQELKGTRLIGEQYLTPWHAMGRFFKF